MSSLAWFQDGVGYGAVELSTWHDLIVPRGSLAHVFRSTSEFLCTSNVGPRTVSVGAGAVLFGGAAGGGTWGWHSGATIAVPAASNDNPRKDLIVARLTTLTVDGVNGVSLELVQGVPAASAQVPARPAGTVALCVVSVPKAVTTFTITPCRTTGQYADQAALCNGSVAVDWSGVLPPAGGFPVGFALYDYGTNQRWVRKGDGTWFTSDPGPWVLCTPQNVQAKDGTNVTVTGTLYIRESSIQWDIQGQLSFNPSKDLDQLVYPATAPASISRPKQNTYGSAGQSYSSNSAGGVGRVALMTTGSIEYGNDGNCANVYINEQLSKSPWNS
ncbi:hypothetical protein ABZV65_04195 [Streptomyces bauhiniae]|uniref:hypothetical protein n=1 Tax=Streptomyces bauhiniae TaxID=2340725 RepID=UPI0033B9E25B